MNQMPTRVASCGVVCSDRSSERSVSRARKPIRTRKTASPLLSPEGTGGIVAGNGFDFQTRYAVCELPGWLVRGLIQMLHEGTGDIDLHFDESRGACRIHIQVKDHEVAPAEFKTAVAHFSAVDGR